MRETFFTSDIHFGHDAIISHCNRPYADVIEMDNAIIQHWNYRIAEKDIVYVLGDFFFRCKFDRAVEIYSQLKGRIFLVPGNHDQELLKWKSKGHFDGLEILSPIHNLKDNHKLYVLCHFPIESWWGKGHGSVHFHGHTHGYTSHITNKRDFATYGGGARIDIGWDARGISTFDELKQYVRVLNNENNNK